MTAAELAARRTAAAAALADYRREVLDGLAGAPVPDWAPWTHRLGNALGAVLDQLDSDGAPVGAPAPASAARDGAGGRLAAALGIAGPAGLTPDQRDVLGQALADAIAHRDPSGACIGCETHSTGLCAEHAGDLDLTDQYLALAEALGIELDL